jgi:hypothetical protein
LVSFPIKTPQALGKLLTGTNALSSLISTLRTVSILTQLPANSSITMPSTGLIVLELLMLLKSSLMVSTSIRNLMDSSTAHMSHKPLVNTHLSLLMMMVFLWLTLPSFLVFSSLLAILILVEQESSILMYIQALLGSLILLVLSNPDNLLLKHVLSIFFSFLTVVPLCAILLDGLAISRYCNTKEC